MRSAAVIICYGSCCSFALAIHPFHTDANPARHPAPVTMLLFIVLLPMLIGSLAGFVLGTRSRLMAAVAACAVTGVALALLLSMAPASWPARP
jgi:hypothetical protein